MYSTTLSVYCHSNLNDFLINGVISNEANASLIPSLSLTMKGNSHFTINDPIIVISTEVILSLFTSFAIVPCLLQLNFHLCADTYSFSVFSQGELVYCLAIVKSSELNIIGRKISFSYY